MRTDFGHSFPKTKLKFFHKCIKCGIFVHTDDFDSLTAPFYLYLNSDLDNELELNITCEEYIIKNIIE